MTVKQIIIVRKDLNMRKGKLAAQVAHASMKVLLDLMVKEAFDITIQEYPEPILKAQIITRKFSLRGDTAFEEWLSGSFTKVVVSVNSEDELLDIYKHAIDLGLIASLIQDSGRTEFHGVPTYTTVAVGPDYAELLEPVTGHLPLL